MTSHSKFVVNKMPDTKVSFYTSASFVPVEGEPIHIRIKPCEPTQEGKPSPLYGKHLSIHMSVAEAKLIAQNLSSYVEKFEKAEVEGVIRL